MLKKWIMHATFSPKNSKGPIRKDGDEYHVNGEDSKPYHSGVKTARFLIAGEEFVCARQYSSHSLAVS